MNEMQVTIVGIVATEVTYGETGSGVPMAKFRLGCTERRYDRQRECWADGETQWLTVTAWRGLAVNLIGSLAKGDPVLVSGRLRLREWIDGEVKRTGAEIDARSVGHDLTRGTSAFRWAAGVRGQPPGAAGRPGRRRRRGGAGVDRRRAGGAEGLGGGLGAAPAGAPAAGAAGVGWGVGGGGGGAGAGGRGGAGRWRAGCADLTGR